MDAPIKYFPFFLEGSKGRIFCLNYEAISDSEAGKAVLFVPPFAEEMNKSRRMYSLLARKLASLGYSSLLVDVYGTGDSEGDHGDASWDVWSQDISQAWSWLKGRGATNISLVALRAGALLAGDFLVRTQESVENLILWQPVLNGETFLTQFLRLKVAAEMTGESASKISTKQIFEELARGNTVEIAGYMISPELANPMASKKLADMLSGISTKIGWLEVVADINRDPPLVNQKLVGQLAEQGVSIRMEKIAGPPFWTATEIVDVPELLEMSTKIISGVG